MTEQKTIKYFQGHIYPREILKTLLNEKMDNLNALQIYSIKDSETERGISRTVIYSQIDDAPYWKK